MMYFGSKPDASASPTSETPSRDFRSPLSHCWIAERDEQWKERIAQLERELAECKADAKDWKNRYEGMAILHSNKVRMIENGDLVRHVNVLKIEKERDALAAQVVQMRDALAHAVKKCGCGGVAVSEREALTLDTKPAQDAINAVKAQALRDFADAQDAIRGGVGLLPFELRRMADELEKK